MPGQAQRGQKKKPPRKKPPAKDQPPGPLKAEDLFVRRTSEGKLIPITTPVAGLGDRTIKVLPTTLGSVKGITSIDRNGLEWELGEKIQFVRDHVVEPDMSQVTEEDVMENMTLWDLDMVLVAAVQAGGPQRSKRQGKD
jgi:hypothetical protein